MSWPEAVVSSVAIICATFLIWRGAGALFGGRPPPRLY
jgi:hypothetical protein